MKKVVIRIKDRELLFSSLKLSQALGELHSFSFNYQIESPNGVTVKTYADFYEEVLDAGIEIEVEQKKIFEGVVLAVECMNQYDFYIDFKISGHCKMFLLDQEEKSNIFNKKKLSDIFKSLTGDVPASIQPLYSEPLHYTVQYNLTAFRMMQMLCKREGEWLYYDGNQIVIKRPDSAAIKLDQSVNEVFDLQLNMKMPSVAAKLGGYDIIKGDKFNKTPKQSGADKQTFSGLVQSKQHSADEESAYHSQTVPFEETLKRYEDLYKAQWLSNTVVLRGKTNNPSVALGAVIEIMNGENSEGTYIVTNVTHYSGEATSYYNHFEAVVEEDKYAPYVDPELKIESALQYATVTQNEDSDGIGRVKVKFWWCDEETCWMHVVTPHAGAGRGFRFLPEIGDSVIVGFFGGNIEAPYLMGSVHHEQAKDAVPEEGNHIKTIATGTNRRIEFDEKRGLLFLTDFYGADKGGNAVHLEKQDGKQIIHIYSRGDEQNMSIIQVDTNEGIKIAILDDNKDTVEIKMDRKGQKMNIFAKKEIVVHSENSVQVKASNIHIEGDQSIKMKTKKFELESDEIKIDAMMEIKMQAGQLLDIASMQTAVKGDTLLNLNGGAQAVLKGGMVMIN